MECHLSILVVGINSKSFPWAADSVQEVTFIQLVAAPHPDANYF